ncbi:MAG TPA: AraC family transcriptional regulator [Longimicrobium sp.]|nr:AraC family transcriptional regulator [Longimicrobium sp.]
MSICLEPGRFYGSSAASNSPAGLILTETAYAGGAAIPQHSHAAPYLCLVVSGFYEECCGTRTESCSPGALIFHPSNSAHSNRFDGAGGICFNIQFGPDWTDRLKDSGLRAMSWGPLPGAAASLAGRVRREAWNSDALSGIAIESLVLSILVDVGRRGEPPRPALQPVWIRRARERITDEFRAPPSVSALAEEAGVHPGHFTRAFRAHTGLTPGEYARAIRVDRAKLLLAGDQSLCAIALELGYADQAHFTRQFRSVVGTPPGAYRRSL